MLLLLTQTVVRDEAMVQQSVKESLAGVIGIERDSSVANPVVVVLPSNSYGSHETLSHTNPIHVVDHTECADAV